MICIIICLRKRDFITIMKNTNLNLYLCSSSVLCCNDNVTTGNRIAAVWLLLVLHFKVITEGSSFVFACGSKHCISVHCIMLCTVSSFEYVMFSLTSFRLLFKKKKRKKVGKSKTMRTSAIAKRRMPVLTSDHGWIPAGAQQPSSWLTHTPCTL